MKAAGGRRACVALFMGLLGCAAAPPAEPRTRAPAAEVDGDELTFTGLQELIRLSGGRTVESLLALLPAAMRARPVLVYESRSLQSATYAEPRVILYSRDARLIVAYNGDPRESGYRVVETMEFDPAGGSFRLRELTYPAPGATDRSGVVVSEPNPPRCLICHRDDPLPIWDTYPSWPGVYGEEERGRPAEEERRGWRSFVRQRADNPRYRALLGPKLAVPSAPLDDAAAYEGKERLSNNARFGVLLEALSFRAIARRVAAAAHFSRLRYALLAALNPRCAGLDRFLPERAWRGFSPSLDDFERETDRANAAQDAAKRARSHAPRDLPPWVRRESLTAFRYLVEVGLGLPTGRWTLALEPATYDFTSPGSPAKVLERELLDIVARDDPGLRELRRGDDPRLDYCEALRARSLTAMQ